MSNNNHEKIYNSLKKMRYLTDKLNFIQQNSIKPSYELLFNFYGERNQQHVVFFGAEYYRLLKDIILINKPKTILDPFCGLGTLLFHLPEEIVSHGLNANETEAKIAHYFNPNAKIECKDALNDPFSTTYDCIASILIPFGQKHNESSELILKLLNSLNNGGSLFLAVPSNILSAISFENIRKSILKEYSLEFIAELPRNQFQGTRFSLIHIKNQKQRSHVLLTTIDDYNENKIISDYVNQEGQFWIPQNELIYRWGSNFHDPKYLEIENELNKQDTKPLEGISEILPGILIPADYRKDKGDYLVLTPGNIKSNSLIISERQYYCNAEDNNSIRNFNRAIIKPGDILISLLGPKFKLYIYNENDPKAVANQNFAIIRASDNKYIKAYLESETGYDVVLQQAQRRSRGATIQRLTLHDLRKIRVPILPYEYLNELIPKLDKLTSFSESKIALVLEEKLKEKGWSIKREYRVNNTIIDLALCIKDKPVGLVEIKQYKSDWDISKIKNQLKHLINATGFKFAFTYFNNQLFEYNGFEFILVEDFPLVNDKLINIFDNGLTTDSVYQNQPSSYSTKFMLEIIGLQIQHMSSNIEEIKEAAIRTEEKIDSIIYLISDLKTEFKNIKNEPFEIDGKLALFNKKLDEKIKQLQDQNKNQLDDYIGVVQSWLSYDWDKLEDLSKQYLPSAEFLFSQLSNLDNTDLSPFIIQYCRALETELLNKIFKAYMDELKANKINVEVEFAWDFGKKENGQHNNNDTFKLVKNVKKCIGIDRSQWFFELGSMEVNLRYLTGKTSKKSPILIDLKKFLFTYFEENILELEFLNELKRITREYRNKAAHSGTITLDEAKKGRIELQDLLKQFLEYYK